MRETAEKRGSTRFWKQTNVADVLNGRAPHELDVFQRKNVTRKKLKKATRVRSHLIVVAARYVFVVQVAVDERSHFAKQPAEAARRYLVLDATARAP